MLAGTQTTLDPRKRPLTVSTGWGEASAEGWGWGAALFIAPSLLELAGTAANSALRRESQGSLNSSASLDLGFLAFVSSKSEVSPLPGETMCGLGPLLRHLCVVASIIPSHCPHFPPPYPSQPIPQRPYFLPVLITLSPRMSWVHILFSRGVCTHRCPGVHGACVGVSRWTCLWVPVCLGEHTRVPVEGLSCLPIGVLLDVCVHVYMCVPQ